MGDFKDLRRKLQARKKKLSTEDVSKIREKISNDLKHYPDSCDSEQAGSEPSEEILLRRIRPHRREKLPGHSDRRK